MNQVLLTKEADISRSLVLRIIVGDNVAEEEMIGRYAAKLHRVLLRKSGDIFTTEDVTQDTWLIVIQKIRSNQLTDKRRLEPFIIGIACNQLIMRYRKYKKNQAIPLDEEHEIGGYESSPERLFVNVELAEKIFSNLSNLSQKRDRDMLGKFYIVGHSKQVLCKEYGLREAHFDRVMHRARERFKALYNGYDGAMSNTAIDVLRTA